MASGSWTIFQKALLKWAQGNIDLDSHSFKMVLTTSSQALSNSFVGSSGDCRYADLTAELGTGSGYTAGGAALTPSLTQLGSTITWSSATVSWSISATLTFKYLVIYDDSTANKDLVCFALADSAGGNVSASLSPLSVQLSSILEIDA